MNNRTVLQHWPVILVVVLVCLIFGLSLITYQVNFTEHAVVLRFGKPVLDRDTSPGLKVKWPFETVWRADNRVRCFEGNAGVVEEVYTRDGKNITVTVYIGWKISEEGKIVFLERIANVDRAEDELTALLRSYKSAFFGQYEFRDLINIDPGAIKIEEIEDKMLGLVKKDAIDLYGIDVRFLGIKHIGFPKAITGKVFERMKAERDTAAQTVLSEGDAAAVKIRAEADKEREILVANAENDAKRIRGEGDAAAAENYTVFQKNPELASFLRKLDSLKSILSEKTVLILDTDTAPYDLLKKDALTIPND